MVSLGHVVFDGGPYDLNLFGIRAKTRDAGTFDDLIGCAYLDEKTWRVVYWPATTDPGLRGGILATQNPKGAAILAPGQYPGAYQIGTHGKNGYQALVQWGGRVAVYRDANQDSTLDTAGGVDYGFFGINIHASTTDPYNTDTEKETVGGWSEGCQVHATAVGFRDMMDLARLQVVHHPTWKTFTYTLLDQWW
jgi:hypothetical protein